MKKKTIKLSSSDLESLVKRIVKENKGEQLSLEFPDYDERHPYLIEIEQRLQELNVESRINEILETVGDINLVHAIENIESELLSLETELQTLEKEVYDNEELPQEVTWGIVLS